MQGLPAVRCRSAALTYFGSATALPAPGSGVAPSTLGGFVPPIWTRFCVFFQNVVCVAVTMGRPLDEDSSTKMACGLFDRITLRRTIVGAGEMYPTIPIAFASIVLLMIVTKAPFFATTPIPLVPCTTALVSVTSADVDVLSWYT